MNRWGKIAAAAGIAVVVTGGAAIGLAALGDSIDHTETERITVSEPVRKLVVTSGYGDVQLRGADTDTITITRTMNWQFDEPDATHHIQGSTLRLSDECGDTDLLFSCETDYVITVPRDLPVEVDASWGDVDANSLAGPLHMTSNAGDLDAAKLTSTYVEASSEFGDIGLRFDAAPTIVNAKSDSGDLDLRLPNQSYAVSATSETGDASVIGVVEDDAADRAIEVESETGDVTVNGN